MIFTLERLLSGGTKLTWGHANKVGKPVLHIYETRKERIPNPDSLRLEIQALADFLRSNKIAVLNVAGPRESNEPGNVRHATTGCGDAKEIDREINELNDTLWRKAAQLVEQNTKTIILLVEKVKNRGQKFVVSADVLNAWPEMQTIASVAKSDEIGPNLRRM